MSIQINIHVPDDEIGQGRAALEKRMAVLGYTFGAAAIPVIAGDAANYGTGAMLVTEAGAEHVAQKDIYAQVAEDVAEKAKTEEPKKATRRKAKDEKSQISTQPENRVDPQDDAETAAQDEADETAEAEAARDDDKPLTIDDFRAAAGDYIQRFGMEAAQADGPVLLKSALGEPPAGNPFWKMTLVAEAGQDALRKAIGAWTNAASADKRFGGA